jgi:hypothetical protein
MARAAGKATRAAPIRFAFDRVFAGSMRRFTPADDGSA